MNLEIGTEAAQFLHLFLGALISCVYAFPNIKAWSSTRLRKKYYLRGWGNMITLQLNILVNAGLIIKLGYTVFLMNFRTKRFIRKRGKVFSNLGGQQQMFLLFCCIRRKVFSPCVFLQAFPFPQRTEQKLF
jgi:hypothetical protein